MKPCKYEELAHLYPFGVLSEREKARFETHIGECAACRAIMEETGAIRSMAAAMEPAEPLAGLEERILNRIPDRKPVVAAPEPRWAFLRRWQRALIPASATVSLALLPVVLLTSPNKLPATAQPAPQAAAADTAPSTYLVAAALDTDAQSYLADDSETALENYYDSLIVSGE